MTDFQGYGPVNALQGLIEEQARRIRVEAEQNFLVLLSAIMKKYDLNEINLGDVDITGAEPHRVRVATNEHYAKIIYLRPDQD